MKRKYTLLLSKLLVAYKEELKKKNKESEIIYRIDVVLGSLCKTGTPDD